MLTDTDTRADRPQEQNRVIKDDRKERNNNNDKWIGENGDVCGMRGNRSGH